MVRETGNRWYTELSHYHRSLKGEFHVNRRNLDDELLSLLINKEIVTHRILSKTMKVYIKHYVRTLWCLKSNYYCV